MPVETGDIIVVMKPKSEWVSATNRVDMHAAMEKTMSEIPGVASEYSQPIQMRFNELMTGSRADIAIKLYGDDLDQLTESAEQAKAIIDQVPGVGTVKVEQTDGMPQLLVDYNYAKLAQYGLQVREVNRVIRTAFAGQPAGTIYEGDRRFDLTVRLAEKYRNDLEDVSALFLPVPGGAQVPLSAVASVELIDAPMQINRDNTNRHTIISVNVGDTDVQTLVEAIQAELDEKVDLPAGYYFTYGGQFENLQAASARLAVAVPVALLLIFILLYFTFGSFSQAALIFVAIPLSAIGGIFALELRGMPFSISAGIGFIALFGVAVLNGIVLIGYLNQLKEEGMTNVRQRILEGTRVRLRPVIMTAAVASLGFLPMALSNSGGAEVQRPLATVVIGGLLTATFLTLIVLPILYSWLEGKQRFKPQTLAPLLLLPLLLFSQEARAQVQEIGLEEAVEAAQLNHPALRAARATTKQSRQLQDLPYAPGVTNLSYRGDGLFRANGQQVNQLGILQNFENPAIVRAQNLRQEVVVKGNELSTSLTAAGIRLEVEQLIYRMQYQNSLASLYSAYDVDAKELGRIARLRADTGAGGLVEVNAAGRLIQETDFEAAFSRSQLSPLVSQLVLVTGSKTLVRNSDTLTLVRRPSPQQSPANTLQVQLANTQTNLAMAEITQAKAALKPSFQLGYSAQNYFEDGFLHGVQAGINIPLFKGPQKQRIQALEVATEISRTTEELVALQEKQRYQETVAEIDRQQIRRQQLLTVQRTDLRIAELTRLRYLAGEASYFEYQEAIKQIYATKLAEQELLLNHNLAVARLHYLLTE
jgi:cobalt-zinc-cadmium resistance protein CzcA